MANFKVGDKVEWSSQSGGYEKVKRGEVIAVAVGRDNPIAIVQALRPGTPRSRINFDATYAGMLGGGRYVIEVRETSAKGDLLTPKYYAPLISVVDRQSIPTVHA